MSWKFGSEFECSKYMHVVSIDGEWLWMQFSLDVEDARNKAKANRQASQQRLQEFTFNMDTGAVSQRVVSHAFGDFPSIPRHLAGEYA